MTKSVPESNLSDPVQVSCLRQIGNKANRRAINQAKELINTVLEMKATDTAIAVRIALLANCVKHNVA